MTLFFRDCERIVLDNAPPMLELGARSGTEHHHWDWMSTRTTEPPPSASSSSSGVEQPRRRTDDERRVFDLPSDALSGDDFHRIANYCHRLVLHAKCRTLGCTS